MLVMSPCICIRGTWHLTQGPGHRDIVGVVSSAPVLSRHDVTLPIVSPPPLIQFPSHMRHDEADLFLKISSYPPSSILSKQAGPSDTWYTWSQRDHGESWCTGDLESLSSDEMSQCHRAQVIYRGLESAKLSRSGGLPPPGPPSDTDTIKLTKTRALTFIEEILIHDRARLTGAGQSNIH